MAPITLVMLASVLLAVFLVVVAALVWQEGKNKTYDEGHVYVVDDAVRFIEAELESSTLRTSDIKRIIEYEVFYLQGLAQKRRRNPVDVIAGGSDAAVEYIQAQIADTHGVSYPLEDIRAALAHEAAYLASIGAVGEPVTDENRGGVEE